jgi:regulatory protein
MAGKDTGKDLGEAPGKTTGKTTGKITDLQPQKRAKDRVNVYVDGEFAVGLAWEVARDLRVGMPVTDADIARLKAADEVEQAREQALNYLSYRPRSEAEVRRYLQGKRDVSEAAVDEVLERLRRVDLVDDLAFARYWVENRARFRPRGKRRLRYELRQKGVPSDAIEGALDAYDEAQAARDAAQAQARRLSHLPPETFRRRFTQRMARRGFSYHVIRELLDDLLEELPFSDFISNESEENST